MIYWHTSLQSSRNIILKRLWNMARCGLAIIQKSIIWCLHATDRTATKSSVAAIKHLNYNARLPNKDQRFTRSVNHSGKVIFAISHIRLAGLRSSSVRKKKRQSQSYWQTGKILEQSATLVIRNWHHISPPHVTKSLSIRNKSLFGSVRSYLSTVPENRQDLPFCHLLTVNTNYSWLLANAYIKVT
jgi:hypothetical protein